MKIKKLNKSVLLFAIFASLLSFPVFLNAYEYKFEILNSTQYPIFLKRELSKKSYGCLGNQFLANIESIEAGKDKNITAESNCLKIKKLFLSLSNEDKGKEITLLDYQARGISNDFPITLKNKDGTDMPVNVNVKSNESDDHLDVKVTINDANQNESSK